ncbi:MAG: flagellar hook-length control protein FliK [Chloroflexi bacterium]|nr:flagellar hook-length control protein FliK [Chloroflexota bacterium]
MEPVAPVTSTIAGRLPALGFGTLTAGQLVQARVSRVDGDQVRLQWGEHTFNASSRVPLTVGQQVNLMVEESASGKMLLRMVDDTFGRARQTRGAESSGSQTAGTAAPATGARQGPIAPVAGRSGQPGSDGQGQAGSQQGSGQSNGQSGQSGRPEFGSQLPTGLPGQPTSAAGQPSAANGQPGLGLPGQTLLPGQPARAGFAPGLGQPNGGGSVFPGSAAPGGPSAGTPWMPGAFGLPTLAGSAEALASLMFTQLDGRPGRAGVAGATGPQAWSPSGAVADPEAANDAATEVSGATGSQRTAPGVAASTGLIAKSAMPTYGRLAQSVGGAVAFGQLLATNTPEISQTLARASLAPTDLGRLLVNLGVHPDEMNAVLVGELLAQGVTVQEGTVRNLRREVAAAGGSLRDVGPAVSLMRLGLPITPLSLAVARQLQAGQFAPSAAWGELLDTMQQLTRSPMSGSQAGVLAAELLADWRVPLEEGAAGIARWLQQSLDRTGTPLEAKLARPALDAPPPDGTSRAALTSPGQDVRARLDLLAQSLPPQAREGRSALATSLSASLQRVQATVQGEQLLNGSPAAPAERSEPRFFAVTIPTVMGQQLSTLEMRVRERDARPTKPGEPARPDVVQLRLNLPGLGDLAVNLTVGQHSVACHFGAATPFAEALLNASASELVGRLKRLGYGHTTVDAAHEPPPPAPSSQTGVAGNAGSPRLHQVDVHA